MAKNRSELVAEVAGKAGTSQAAVNSVLDALFEVFETSVAAGEKITIPGWLAVERTDRAARTGRNPPDGRDHPDRRRPQRQADRRLQAEGCCLQQEVSFFLPASKPGWTRGGNHVLAAPFAFKADSRPGQW